MLVDEPATAVKGSSLHRAYSSNLLEEWLHACVCRHRATLVRNHSYILDILILYKHTVTKVLDVKRTKCKKL